MSQYRISSPYRTRKYAFWQGRGTPPLRRSWSAATAAWCAPAPARCFWREGTARTGRDASFRTFAEICIRSRLYSAVRAAQGSKHSPLNHSVSFEPPLFDGTNAYLFSSEESPEDVIIGREELRERLDALKGQLSEFEASILSPYLSGLSCGEIARRVGRSPKAVDNAVQRIRRKVARNFSSSGSSES